MQQEIDSIITSVVELYQTELANKLNPVGILKHNRHSFKAWWNENLNKLCQGVCEAEKNISKDNSKPDRKRTLGMIYEAKQNRFYKHINDLSEMNSSMWKKLIQKYSWILFKI